MRFIFLLFLHVCLFATDFDCILVGSSPFSLFEALYQSHSGHRVLIIEDAPECGGAWKSITACGIPNADLGCHQIGHDMRLKEFLEEYAGCTIVSMDQPLAPFENHKSPNGYYFSQGCFELIDHLLKLIARTNIVILNNTHVENISVDTAENTATVHTHNASYTTTKLIVTPMSCIRINSLKQPSNHRKSKHYHLYLLIQDPTSPRFSYHHGIGGWSSRLMNLTYFVGLAHTGQQLIVIQTHNEQYLKNSQSYLDHLKAQMLIDPSAYILKEESVIYETGSFHQELIGQLNAHTIIEVLQTGHFQSLANYLTRWKQTLKPYGEVVRE